MSTPESGGRPKDLDSLIRVKSAHGKVSILSRQEKPFTLDTAFPGENPDDFKPATPQEIDNQMLHQKVKYVILDRMGTLTPQWRKFGRRYREDIRNIESMLEKEA